MYISYGKRVATKLSLVIILILIGAALIYINAKEETNLNLGYTESSKLDYKVNLKENEFYEEEYLEKGKEYLSSLINYIDIQFYYDFELNEHFYNKYNYYIETKVVVYGKTKDAILYINKETLHEETIAKETKEKAFDLTKNVKIDYQKYNNLAKKYKTEYGLNNESELIIRFVVEIDGKHEEQEIKNSSDIELRIPLTQQTVTIDTDYKEWNETNVLTVARKKTPTEYAFIGVGSISALVGIFLLIKLTIFIKRTTTKAKTSYDKIIKKILNDYDRNITNIKEPIKITENMTVIDVTTFSELLDISDRIEKSILYNEIHKGQKSIFIVQDGNQIYRVVIKSIDLEPKENRIDNKLKTKSYEKKFRLNKNHKKKN